MPKESANFMRPSRLISATAGVILAAVCAAPGFAQQQYPQQQYPAPQQYPQQQQPYPQQQQPYPQQGQYPPPQYPPQQGQYPPQGYPQGAYQPPLLPPQQLDPLVGPIALYPDGLLAQVLTASTFANQIPDAAGWANQHAYIRGDALAQAIQQDNLPFDPSIQALLPFPQVLSYMAQNMGWTEQLGNAVLAQRGDVMDAVQRMRAQAYQYGYLRDPQYGQYERVIYNGPGAIEIVPVNPGFYYVPYYNPIVVYARPRRAFIGGVFSFGPGITIGAAFAPWGWGGVGFGWREHTILVDRRPWTRTWVNRQAYVHPYAAPFHPAPGPRVEHHEYRPEYRPAPHHDEHRDEHHDHH